MDRALHISVSHNPVMEALTLSKVQWKIFEKVEIFGGTQPSAELFREGLCTGLEFRFGRRKSSHHFEILKFLSCDQIWSSEGILLTLKKSSQDIWIIFCLNSEDLELVSYRDTIRHGPNPLSPRVRGYIIHIVHITHIIWIKSPP